MILAGDFSVIVVSSVRSSIFIENYSRNDKIPWQNSFQLFSIECSSYEKRGQFCVTDIYTM